MIDQQKFKNAIYLGIIYGITILTPHLQLAYYILWFIIIFTIYKIILILIERHKFRIIVKPVSLLVVAITISLMISCIQLLPSYDYLSNYSPRSDSDKGLEFSKRYSLHSEEIFSQIIPEFCGLNPKDGKYLYWGKNAFKDNSESLSIVTIFAALLVFFLKGKKHKYFWGILSIFVLCYASGTSTPLFGLTLKYIPLAKSMSSPSSAIFIYVFSISLLGGMAIDSIFNNRTRRKKVLYSILLIIPLIFLIISEHWTLFGKELILKYCEIFHNSILPSEPNIHPFYSRSIENLSFLIPGLWRSTIIVSLFSVLIYLVLRFKYLKKLLWILPLLIYISVFNFNSRFICLFNYPKYFNATSMIEYLQDNIGYNRTIAYSMYQPGLKLSFHRIYSHLGIHGKEPDWYYKLLGKGSKSNKYNSKLINLTGTRYIICEKNKKPPLNIFGKIPLDSINSFENYNLYLNYNSLPRTYLLNQFEVFDSLSEIHERVLRGDENLREIVYLEEEPTINLSPSLFDSSFAEIEFYNSDSISINVRTSTNQFLVLSDNYYDAWHAYVDGQESKIYRAYGSFRGVVVPSGTKKVVFKYYSEKYQTGKCLTILGFLIVFSVLGFNGYTKTKQKYKHTQ